MTSNLCYGLRIFAIILGVSPIYFHFCMIEVSFSNFAYVHLFYVMLLENEGDNHIATAINHMIDILAQLAKCQGPKPIN